MGPPRAGIKDLALPVRVLLKWIESSPERGAIEDSASLLLGNNSLASTENSSKPRKFPKYYLSTGYGADVHKSKIGER
ncbi:Histone-lysine N-methyltransferase SUVR4 [Corchorus olitorius]|uniref:Histone-lysine N-methyltransferase SUVR4 n=1 Tax=Corchorus olitorius TaxID=93759 RepID=A0A1R3KZX6_9ROSI|nr:Histone-lysine N-methyltransferase SUVR4 [Corchorus olitorius]